MKWFVRSLIVILSILLIILTVCFTESGNKWLWKQLQANIAPLDGELISGHVGKGWVFHNLAWDDDQINFSANELAVAWNPSKLIHGRLWLTNIEVKNPSLALALADDDSNNGTESNNTNTDLSIPLTIDIDRVNITGFQLSQKDLYVSFKEFATGLHLKKSGLTINDTLLANLAINPIADQQKEAPSSPSKPVAEEITLPNIQLPVPVSVNKLQLTHLSYGKESIPELTLSLEGKDHDISINYLDVVHPIADARLSGKITLSKNYPLVLTLNSTLKQTLMDGALKGEAVHFDVSGSLAELGFDIQAKGSVNASIAGSVEPLKPEIPFNLQLDWEPLQWPLTGDNPDIRVDQGQLLTTGNLTNYTLSINTVTRVPAQPPVTIELKGAGDTSHLTFNKIALKTPEGAADISGVLNWQQGIDWKGKIDLANVNPAYWTPDIPGRINGHAESRFKLAGEEWVVSIPNLKLEGELRDNPIHINGQIEGDNQLHWTIHKLAVITGKNTITAEGKLADTWNLNAKISGEDLAQLYPGLRGSLTGNFQLTGSQEQPNIHYQIQSPSLAWQNFSLSELDSEGSIAKRKEFEGQVKLNLNQLNGDGLALKNISIEANGRETSHYLSLKTEGTPVSTKLMLTGIWQNGLWQGNLKQALINSAAGSWRLEQPLHLSLNDKQVLSLSEQCWQSGISQFCMEPAIIAANHGQAAFTLNQLEIAQLKPFFPDNFSWQAQVSGHGQVKWEKDRPELNLLLSSTPGTLEAGALQSEYESLVINAEIAEQNLQSTLSFKSKQLGQADINLAIKDITEKRLLGGRLSINDLMLDVLAPFLPDVSNLNGTFSAQGHFDGSVDKPLFYGDLALTEGRLETTADIVTINNLTTRLAVNGHSGVVSGQMDIGDDGRLELGGNIDWQNLPPQGQITVKGNDLEFQYPGIGKVKVKPDLSLKLADQQHLTGSLSIPWARIKVKDLPQHAVTQSDDVIIIRPGESTSEKKEVSTPLDIKIKVLLGDDVQLDAFGLQTHLAGGLGILQEPEKPLEVHGTIQLKEGRYRSFGQNLIIREGKIIFSGPPDNPYLVVEAIRNPDAIEDNVTVGVIVNGPVTRPDWNLFSDPSMPQTEQFSYLLRGRAMKAGSGDNAALQSMLLGLGVSQIGDVVSNLGEAVGIKDVTLDTEGSGDDTQVTVSGYVSPKIQVQYGVGVFSSIGEVKVRYELMTRLYLQAVSGLAQALDIFYRFSL